mmetsp:Transcript_27742/g.87666  ORF Transcript_27742/g.87666 Transcript_27742/m.87666 type:complete len:271 (+) Transcript_27742:568-1380(+)
MYQLQLEQVEMLVDVPRGNVQHQADSILVLPSSSICLRRNLQVTTQFRGLRMGHGAAELLHPLLHSQPLEDLPRDLSGPRLRELPRHGKAMRLQVHDRGEQLQQRVGVRELAAERQQAVAGAAARDLLVLRRGGMPALSLKVLQEAHGADGGQGPGLRISGACDLHDRVCLAVAWRRASGERADGALVVVHCDAELVQHLGLHHQGAIEAPQGFLRGVEGVGATEAAHHSGRGLLEVQVVGARPVDEGERHHPDLVGAVEQQVHPPLVTN